VFILASDSLEGRGLGTKGGEKAADYIIEQFRKIGLTPLHDEYRHPFYHRQGQVNTLTGNNIVGIIEGNDPELKNEYILVGAHYDHVSFEMIKGEKVVFNGADDNASGTASLIEVAGELMGQKDRLKRSIIFVAFDGEESGLLGSFAFVDQEVIPKEQIKFMLSIDMVGRYGESLALYLPGIGNMKGGKEIAGRVAEKYQVELKQAGKQIPGRTDTKGFALEGIPSVHVTSGKAGPYHEPADDANTLDYEGIALICQMISDIIVETTGDESLRRSDKLVMLEFNRGLYLFRCGLKASAGSSYHHYRHEFYNSRKKFSSELGLTTQLNLLNYFFQPEILYSTMAGSYQDKSNTLRTHSITVPISVGLATPMLQPSDLRFYCYIGGYYSFYLNNGEDFAEYDKGFHTGIGMEISSMFFNYTMKWGGESIGVSNTSEEFYNRASYFTIGYYF